MGRTKAITEIVEDNNVNKGGCSCGGAWVFAGSCQDLERVYTRYRCDKCGTIKTEEVKK